MNEPNESCITESQVDQIEMEFLKEIEQKSRSNVTLQNGIKGDICFGCEDPINEGELFLNANTLKFHPHCFKCVVCGSLFNQENQFFQVQNLPFCEHHHHLLFSPTCFKVFLFLFFNFIKFFFFFLLVWSRN